MSSTSSSSVRVDYVEPSWHCKPNPYYNSSHRAFQRKIRVFVDKEILPYIHSWDEKEKYPAALRIKAYKAGIYGALWDEKYGGTPHNSEALSDPFYMLIWHDELARCGSGGLMASCFLPNGWALLPVLKHHLQASLTGSNPNKEAKIARALVTGDKTIALCVTEPTAGSDVFNIQTVARTDPNDSNFLLVTGEKYFISNGMNADYLTVAVRLQLDDANDGSAAAENKKKLSFLLVDVNECNQNKKSVFRSKMKTEGWKVGGTAYIVFKDARVPRENLVGAHANGFVPILENFNHGRFAIASTTIRYARVCLEDAVAFGQKRKTFGKRLIDHAVIRHKVVEMARKLESTQSLMEMITYQMKCGKMNDRMLGKYLAMVKIDAAKTLEFCAREASQIFGGRSYLRGGTASRVERIYREVTVMAIAEGATEVLNDFIARQSKL